MKHCVDALTLLFRAAAKPGRKKIRGRLPGVLDSFMQWCEQTREDFQLGPEIDEQLEKRRGKIGVTFTYREWRQAQREEPAKVAALGFKDDRTKRDDAALRLEGEGRPAWAPGRSMRWPRPARTEVVVQPHTESKSQSQNSPSAARNAKKRRA